MERARTQQTKRIKAAALVILALAVAWLGGLSRPYRAFGGEDVLALIIIIEAVRTAAKKGR